MHTHKIECGDRQEERGESAEQRALRDALGAVAIDAPQVYRLYRGGKGRWHIQREGETRPQRFPDRESALSAIRLAVVRCTSYCLLLQGPDGHNRAECFDGYTAGQHHDQVARPEAPKATGLCARPLTAR